MKKNIFTNDGNERKIFLQMKENKIRKGPGIRGTRFIISKALERSGARVGTRIGMR